MHINMRRRRRRGAILMHGQPDGSINEELLMQSSLPQSAALPDHSWDDVSCGTLS